MRIAFETTPLTRPGSGRGLGRYVKAVESAALILGHELAPVVMEHRDGRLAEIADLLERRRTLRRLEFDLFHATTAYTTAGPTSHPTITSILDVIPLDVRSHRRTGLKARLLFRLASRSKVILTLSSYSASRIHAVLHVPDSKIVVAPLPPRPVFQPEEPVGGYDKAILERHRIRHPYFIAVGDTTAPDPRKRLEWLGAVARAIVPEGYVLVVVGPAHQEPVLPAGAITVGRIPDEELAALYRSACALVYTSAYEGQGLPPLEALACGVPVVSMANTSIPEVVGPAGLLVEEDYPPARAAEGPHRDTDPACVRLAEACLALIHDDSLRRSLVVHTSRQAGNFDESRFARALGTAYTAAVS